MRSKIFLTNWVMVDVLFMNLINNAAVLKLRKKNFKLLLRKLKLLWNKKKTRFSELNWNLDKFVKRLIGRSRKRKGSLTILERTTKEQWTPGKLLLKLNLEQRLRPSALRKSLNLTSMN